MSAAESRHYVSAFDLDTPAVVAFSGGRTSGYMLWRILQAHGGKLPEGYHVVFCNTGKERPETLDFVQECSTRWAVPVVWLEYRWEPGRHYYEVVDYNTASRDGRPFNEMISSSAMLPNRVARKCTIELKVKTMWRWCRDQGLAEYTKAVGLRWDEPGRVLKLLQTGGEYTLEEPALPGMEAPGGPPRQDTGSWEHKVCPLSDAQVSLHDVMEFWKAQPFDLQLKPHEGNCDLCFLKRKGSILAIMKERPDLAAWWIEQEQGGKLFRSTNDRPRYELLLAQASEPGLFDGLDDEDDIPCSCTD